MYYEHSKYAEYYGVTNSLALEHYGIKGQKWGLRRWQNEDGTLTEAGKDHYSVSTGGNKKLQRLYNRESKKLKRLKDYADIDLQKKNAEKYDKRFKKAMKVGNMAASVAAGAALNQLGSQHKDYVMDRKDEKFAKNYFNAHRDLKTGDVKKEDVELLDNLLTTRNSARNSIAYAKNYVALASAGVAAGAYATAAYNKLMSRAASKRVSDIGHEKAVNEYKKQYNKMMNTFAGISYSDILKQQ